MRNAASFVTRIVRAPASTRFRHVARIRWSEVFGSRTSGRRFEADPVDFDPEGPAGRKSPWVLPNPPARMHRGPPAAGSQIGRWRRPHPFVSSGDRAPQLPRAEAPRRVHQIGVGREGRPGERKCRVRSSWSSKGLALATYVLREASPGTLRKASTRDAGASMSYPVAERGGVMKVAVIGAGSWGTTIAAMLAPSCETILWSRRVELAEHINERHQPGLPPRLRTPSRTDRHNEHRAAQSTVPTLSSWVSRHTAFERFSNTLHRSSHRRRRSSLSRKASNSRR